MMDLVALGYLVAASFIVAVRVAAAGDGVSTLISGAAFAAAVVLL